MIIGRMKYRLVDLLTTKGDIAYRATTVAARLAAGTDGKYLKMASGIPAWAYAYLIGLLTADGDIAIRSSGAPAALHKGSDGEILTLVSGLPAWAAALAVLTVAETEVFDGTSPTSWTDLDLSSVVGANVALVMLKVLSTGEGEVKAFRKNGDTDESYSGGGSDYVSWGVSTVDTKTIYTNVIVVTDAAGKIEWRTQTAETLTLDVIAFIK